MKSFTFSLAIVLAIYCYSGAAVENRGEECTDTAPSGFCSFAKSKHFCNRFHVQVQKICAKTCGICTAPEENRGDECMDSMDSSGFCWFAGFRGLCGDSQVQGYCPKTCGICTAPEENRGAICKDKWSNCDDLKKYCNDPWNAHIPKGCPKACGVCTAPIANYGSMTVRSCNMCYEKPENSYCKYEAGVLGPKCANTWTVSVPESEKKILVDKHNELRSLVAKGTALPGIEATNMMRLEWDDDIAEGAQLWANQCTFGHDKDRSTCGGFVGQNSAKNSGGDEMNAFRMEEVTQRWYNEIEFFKAAPKELQKSWIQKFVWMGPGSIQGTGHFSQIVWAKTAKVGCAAIAFDNGNTQWPRDLVHICNYYPAANFGGQPVFLTDGDCPAGTKRGSDGLCG